MAGRTVGYRGAAAWDPPEAIPRAAAPTIADRAVKRTNRG